MYKYLNRLDELLPTGIVPSDFFTSPNGTGLLDKLYFSDFCTISMPAGLGFQIRLAIIGELAITIPGLDGISIIFGASAVQGTTEINLMGYVGEDDVEVRLDDVKIAVRFQNTILKPVSLEGGMEPEPYAEITTSGSIVIDKNLEIHLEGFDGISLPPTMVGESGVIISASSIKFDFSRTETIPEVTAAGFDESFLGVFIGEAQVQLPEGLPRLAPEKLILRNAAIGSGGVSGRLEAQYGFEFDSANKVFTGDGAGELFGIQFGVSNVVLDFIQNSFRESGLAGQLLLPFFDKRVSVDLTLNLDGNVTAKLTGAADEGDTSDPNTGLLTLRKDPILSIEVESISFEVQGGTFISKLSGRITPLFGRDQGLDWPSFEVKELAIDSNGNVHLDGGWLDLREQYSLNFHGFKMEITKLGFGKTEDGGKWMGFSGGLKLVDGLSAGASVDGLRITWYDDGRSPEITLNGVGVEFEVPEVLHFKGSVSYDDGDNKFSGDIRLDLISLEFQVDGKLVFGQDDQTGENYMAIYLALELPAGIPLLGTGLALYGMAGLFAYQMEPNKPADQPWYGIGVENSWYHSGTPGVVDLNKWRSMPDSLALGAGITIGTVSDNGYAFSGKMLLVIVFPGPILLIEGKANLLKERAKLDEEPVFRALAVLDKRAETFLIGLDAQYKYNDAGKLIDIHGGAEAFFTLGDSNAWHLYLGEKEPRDRRIIAKIFQLFEANTYLMLNADELAMGAWVGYDKNWQFGPLRVSLEAWIEGNAIVSWKPAHFYGDLWLHGLAGLSVYGYGLELSVDARIAGDVFDPFHVLGELSVGINLPWPLPDFHPTITLEWPTDGPDLTPPPLPLPLKEISIEHFKVTTSWPLPRGSLLLPICDSDNNGFRDAVEPAPVDDAFLPDPDAIPVVPLDCRPHITFSRPMHDDALVGENPQPPSPEYERIGDPDRNAGPIKVRYGLKQIELQKRDGTAWQTVASSPSDDPKTKLYGSWAPVPAMPDGGGTAVSQVKLWLWSKTPFDYTRHTGSAWDDWFTNRFGDYPCLPIPEDQEICYDFNSVEPNRELTSPWVHPEEVKLVFSWLTPPVLIVANLDQPINDYTKALYVPEEIDHLNGEGESNNLTIVLPQPAKQVRLFITSSGEGSFVTGYNADGESFGPVSGGMQGNPEVVVTGEAITRIIVQPNGDMSLAAICIMVGLSEDERHTREEMERHMVDEMARWSQEGALLRPHTTYRLKIVTTIQTVGMAPTPDNPDAYDYSTAPDFNLQHEQVEFAYFQTEGPPGLTALSVPIGCDPGEFARDAGLGDLTRYVHQTIPATVPDQGEKPLLPRPVYRAYDVGVEFNEDYVDLMYRIDGHDLGLYLYDSNNRPVRDAQGRLIVLRNRWGRTEELTLTESEERWINTVNGGDCATLDITIIPHDRTLAAAANGQILNPDTGYEARLVPLLLHEDFNAYPVGTSALGLAIPPQVKPPASPSQLAIDYYEAIANALRSLGLDVEAETSPLIPPGWVLYVVGYFLYRYYVQRILASILSLLPNFDQCTIDQWTAWDEGTNRGPSHWEIRETGTPPSRYIIQTTNIWGGTLDGNDPVKPGTILLYADNLTLPEDHPKQPGNWTDYRMSVYLRSSDDEAIGIVFRYIALGHYYLFSMDCQRKYRRLVKVKDGNHTILAEDDFVYRLNQDYLIAIEAIGSSLRVYQDGELVFDVTDNALDHGRIGLYCWGNTGARFRDVRVDDFRPEAPIVYRFKFTTSNFVDFFHHMHSFQDETWRVELPAGALLEADLAALVAKAADPASPITVEEVQAYETLARHTLGQAARQIPADVQLTRVESDNRALAFLIQGPEPIDWDRTDLEVLYTDHRSPRPELPSAVKLTDVKFGMNQPNEESITLLLRDATDLCNHRIEYRQFPDTITEPVSDPMLFIDEFDLGQGGILFRETFGPNALDHYTIVDEGTELGPSDWAVANGHMTQRSGIYGGNLSGAELDKPGTLALTGSTAWTNVCITTVLRSDEDDTIGIVFRYQDQDNYYHFSMDQEHGYRRLIKKVDGNVCLLWEDNNPQGRLAAEYAFNVLGVRSAAMIHDGSLYASQLVQTFANHFRALGGTAMSQETIAPNQTDIAAGLTRIAADQPELIYCPIFPPSGDLIIQQAEKTPGLENTIVIGTKNTYNLSQSYRLVVTAFGNRLIAYLDDAVLFSVQDPDIKTGRVGFYCWANMDAHFEALEVESLESDPLLWQPAFTDLRELEIIDEAGTIEGPSEWTAVDGVLAQSSNIHMVDASTQRPGTYALAGSANWRNVQISMRLGSNDTGAIGAMLRYQDGDNYYRFSMDQEGGYRQLIKKVEGTVTVLWRDSMQYIMGQSYNLTLRAIGSELRGYLDGILLFRVRDEDLQQGRIGFYCWANNGAWFEDVLVIDPTRRIGQWTIHDEGTVSAPSVWRLSDGALVQRSNIYSGAVPRTDPAKPGSYAIAGDRFWTDYRLIVRLRSDDNDAIGVMFRYQDGDNYYRFSMDRERSYRRLVKKVAGIVTVLWEDAVRYTVGQDYMVTLDCVGERLTGYLDGVRMFEAEDSDLAAGSIGLYCWANSGARFESVEVQRPSPEAYALLRNSFSTDDISHWTFIDEGMRGGPSNWGIFEGSLRQTSDIYEPPIDRNTLSKRGTQAVAGDQAWTDVIIRVRLQSLDDDTIGLLLRYTDADHYYRFSMDNERGYRRLVKNIGGNFTLLWEDNIGYEVGRAYQLTVEAVGSTLRGYLDDVPMFVVEDSDLTSGRIGVYSWGNCDSRFSDLCVYPSALAFSDWMLEELFNFLVPGRWRFVDEGSQQGPSHWEVAEGELQQTSGISDGSSDGNVPDKLGTYALAGDATWIDYRITAQLRSDDDDAIGVMFRYQDRDNYYRFSMDREHSYRRLVKKVNGRVTVLWEDAVQYTAGRDYMVALDCVGDHLTGYLDGSQLFTVEDSDLARGCIGLYCWENTGAHFAEVRVVTPLWMPYYIFKREERLPAGTRLYVFAGNVKDAPPEELGVVRRFVASLEERGRLRLPTDGVDLRLRASATSGGHARRFFSDSHYGAVADAKVLRNADGTAFFILVPTGSPPNPTIPPGQYRLKMIYRRDNQSSDPDSQVLSQGGKSDPERVTLDIPWETQ